jgi:hypothetical protein
VQRDAEARLEGALEHALGMHLQDARIGEAAHQGLPHPRRVGPCLAGEDQRLGHRLDIQRHDDLVGDLRDLTGPVAADEGDVLAHRLEQRQGALEGRLRPADHDGERGVARATSPPLTGASR